MYGFAEAHSVDIKGHCRCCGGRTLEVLYSILELPNPSQSQPKLQKLLPDWPRQAILVSVSALGSGQRWEWSVVNRPTLFEYTHCGLTAVSTQVSFTVYPKSESRCDPEQPSDPI